MDSYIIKPGEVVILREDIVYDHRKTNNNTKKGELILTTESQIFNRKNIWGKVADTEVYPINEIQLYKEKPQVKITSVYGTKNLEIYLNNGQFLKFQIGDTYSRDAAVKWVNAIYELMTGHEYVEFDRSVYTIPEIEAIANFASGTINAFKKSLGYAVKQPEEVVKYCQNCGAQIKGYRGDIGTCEFCGSKQKLL